MLLLLGSGGAVRGAVDGRGAERPFVFVAADELQGALGALVLDEVPKNALLEGAKRLEISEERGDVNEHVSCERRGLVRLCAEHVEVIGQAAHPANRHAPIDATEHGRALVAAKIDAHALPQEREESCEARLLIGLERIHVRVERGHVGMLREPHELVGDALGRC